MSDKAGISKGTQDILKNCKFKLFLSGNFLFYYLESEEADVNSGKMKLAGNYSQNMYLKSTNKIFELELSTNGNIILKKDYHPSHNKNLNNNNPTIKSYREKYNIQHLFITEKEWKNIKKESDLNKIENALGNLDIANNNTVKNNLKLKQGIEIS